MDLTNIKGITDKSIKLLNKLNINSIENLLEYYPFRYNTYHISDLVDNGSTISVIAKIESVAKVGYIKRNLNKLTFRALISNYLVNVTIFNRAFLKNNITIGREITITGKYNRKANNFVANDIIFEKVSSQKIEPVYHLVNGLNNKYLNNLILKNTSYTQFLNDKIPSHIINQYNFISKSDAIKEIHLPSSLQKFKQAKIRTIYEEFFEFLFKINILKLEYTKNNQGIVRSVDVNLVKEFIDNLPFTLTEDQSSAVKSIYKDLISNKRMNRLILGDVGSGKTIVSVIAMYINTLSNHQSALMAPTEVLAKQHYENLTKTYEKYNVRLGLLVGSMKAKEKKEVIEHVKNGSIDILIGTHAILNEKLEYKSLGLVITDEQHRFGVNQRGILQSKGHLCDVLYMSATPIPRTYALTIYGDMDTSIIKTKPSGRQEIITKVFKESELKSVLFKCLEIIKINQQIYVVAPLIESNEETELNDVHLLAEKFNTAFNNKVKIGILHGKMSNTEKNQIMEAYKNNEIKILISTTVIEVGIDVKNSTMMIIFDAERFGLATLHQLRGRVGRNSFQSYCYLICDKVAARLKVMEESNDGFYISEKDFELRGSGDLFGIKQSGDMKFAMGDLQKDYKILLQAKEDVTKYIEDNLKTNFPDNKVYRDLAHNLQIID